MTWMWLGGKAVPMYVDVVPNRKSPPAILLREGWREGKKVRKRTIANLSGWPAEKIESLRRPAQGRGAWSPSARPSPSSAPCRTATSPPSWPWSARSASSV